MSIQMFHRHTWKIIAKTYAPSAREQGINNFPLCSEHLFERLWCGVTTYLMQCQDERCQMVDTKECLGKEETMERL